MDRAPIIDLAAGAYRAQVSCIGAALVQLTHDARPLVYAVAGDVPMPRFRGAILAPWPNRIADGSYQFDGDLHQLAINEVERMTALHGLVLYDPWQSSAGGESSVTLRTVISPQPGYPFTLELSAEYVLDDVDGLAITVTATNVGGRAAPYGTSIHPYLRAGDGSVDDWTFSVDAAEVVAVDPLRLLPLESVSVAETSYDFRGGARIGSRSVDNALTGIAFDATGRADATLVGPDGDGVRMSWDRQCAWLQVHTTDLPGRRDHRRALAVEPMTCAPDAFNSGAGLVRLEPGAQHAVWWRLAALSGVRAASDAVQPVVDANSVSWSGCWTVLTAPG